VPIVGADDDDCVEHVWQLRGVTFDLEIGALEDYECTRCPAVTFRQAATYARDVASEA
jgi:hypothetical protein